MQFCQIWLKKPGKIQGIFSYKIICHPEWKLAQISGRVGVMKKLRKSISNLGREVERGLLRSCLIYI